MSRPAWAALAVLLSFGGLLWRGEPPTRAQALPQVRDTMGLWTGTPITETAVKEQRPDNGEAVRLMEYRMGQEPPVWLTLEGGQGKRASFHPPEICFVGSDFEILEREPVTVVSGNTPRHLMRLVVSQNDNEYEAWYWFTVEDRITHNYYQQQLWLVMDAVRGKRTSGTLVRITTPRDDPQATHRRLLAFLTAYTDSPTLIAALSAR